MGEFDCIVIDGQTSLSFVLFCNRCLIKPEMKSLSNNKVSVQPLSGKSANRLINETAVKSPRKEQHAKQWTRFSKKKSRVVNTHQFSPNIVPVSNSDGNLTSSIISTNELETLLWNTYNIYGISDILQTDLSSVETDLAAVDSRAVIHGTKLSIYSDENGHPASRRGRHANRYERLGDRSCRQGRQPIRVYQG